MPDRSRPLPQRLVTGTDDRVRQSVTAVFPWSAVALVEVRWRDGTRSTGTGFMVGRDDLLTAASLVYSHAHGGWATHIFVTPGAGGDYSPFGRAQATYMNVDSGWLSYRPDPDRDLGYVRLNRTVGDVTGWFAYAHGGRPRLYRNAAVGTAGYPSDVLAHTLWSSTGRVTASTAGGLTLSDTIDATGGQIGSPVWQTGTTAAPPVAIGVVTGDGSGGNRAVRINDAFHENLTRWIRATWPSPARRRPAMAAGTMAELLDRHRAAAALAAVPATPTGGARSVGVEMLAGTS